MIKESLAYVDHNFHKKTRSGDFLREIFKKEYIVDNFWWSLSDENKLIKKLNSYDNFFFFQTLLPFRHLLILKNKNLMWAPMYDNLPQDSFYWKKIKYLNIKILCFSKKVEKIAIKHNCDYVKLKYFIKPKIQNAKKKNKFSIFFWFRKDISIKDWINLFNQNDIKKIVYFNCPDPGVNSEMLTKDFKKKYLIEIIKKKFLKKNEYYKLLKNTDIFISPRKQEGIGMSFVEAMSLGKYVIGFNDATMNEYIINNKIGLLINSKKKSFKRELINKNFDYRKKYMNSIYKKWETDKIKILNFFNKKNNIQRKNGIFEAIIILEYFWKNLKKLIKLFLGKVFFRY